MLKVFSEIKTEYNLLKDDEKLKKQLSDLTSYMEFITALSNILKKDEGYEFFISDKKELLTAIIINKEFINLDSIKEREEYILSVLSELDNYSKEELEMQKNVYVQMKIEQLNQPIFKKNEDLSSVIKTNYLNLRKLKRIERDGNERTIKSLENDKTFLYLVNSLINEYPKVLDREKINFIKTVINNSSREEFDSVKDFLYYEVYKVTTLNNMNKLQNKKTKIKRL